MKTCRITLMLLCIELYVCLLYGQNARREHAWFKSRVLFPLAGVELDTCFQTNGRDIRKFMEQWRQLRADTTIMIDRIVLTGSASPEGEDAMNEKLGEQRVRSLVAWLVQRIDLPVEKMDFINLGADRYGLQRLIERLPKNVHFEDLYPELRRATIEVYWHKEETIVETNYTFCPDSFGYRVYSSLPEKRGISLVHLLALS
ncbi:hypothetical protein [Bacteroides sp.]